MPLPTENIPWPPVALRPFLGKASEWRAWWSGDADALATLYAVNGGTGPVVKPQQYNGGVVGAAARMWWGRPPSAHEPPAKLHIPVASDLCRAQADLLFSEQITATLPEGATDKAGERLQYLLDGGMHGRLVSSAERVGALGGGYLRPVWDDQIADHAWLDPVAADRAVPEWSWGVLRAVTFWRVVHEDKDWTWRHLERHEAGWVQHGLYRGTKSHLGTPRPFADQPTTEYLVPLVNADAAVETGYRVKGKDRLAAWYLPRLLPTPRWDEDPLLSPYGRSILDGVEPLMDALDETYSSLMRDIRLAKGRLTVDSSVLEDHGPGRGATFDPDREVYSGINMFDGGTGGGTGITVSQFAIRTDEHLDTAANILRQILRASGLAASTLGEDDQGAPITAREVTARGQRSYVTQGRMIQYQRPELEGALHGLMVIDAYRFKSGIGEIERPNVEFSDNIADDVETIAETLEKLERSRSMALKTRVQMLHKDWDEPQVDAEVAAILADQGPILPAPFDHDAERAEFERGQNEQDADDEE